MSAEMDQNRPDDSSVRFVNGGLLPPDLPAPNIALPPAESVSRDSIVETEGCYFQVVSRGQSVMTGPFSATSKNSAWWRSVSPFTPEQYLIRVRLRLAKVAALALGVVLALVGFGAGASVGSVPLWLIGLGIVFLSFVAHGVLGDRNSFSKLLVRDAQGAVELRSGSPVDAIPSRLRFEVSNTGRGELQSNESKDKGANR